MPQPAKKPSKVLVCASSKPAELITTLPITPGAGAKRRITLRLGPDKSALLPFPDLQPGDQLKVLVELEVTTDCRTEGQGDCLKPLAPYTWGPRVRARLLLANNRTATEKKAGTAKELDQESVVVTQDRHHYVFTLEAPYTIPADWKARENNIIVAVDANNRAAGRNHRLLIGANEGGQVAQDMARVNIVRLRSGDDPPPTPVTTRQLRVRSLPLTKGKKVVLTLPLEGLKKDEQLVVGGFIEASGLARPYPARLSARVFLADNPADIDLAKESKKVEPVYKGEISDHNGSNCLPGEMLEARKVGVLRVARNAGRTHHVNVVCESADPVFDRTDAPLALTRGSLSVTRYPASWRG
jgi:hypothetical protein